MSISHVHIYFPSTIVPGAAELSTQTAQAYDLRKISSWTVGGEIASDDPESPWIFIQARVEGLPFDGQRIIFEQEEFETAKQASLDAEPVTA